jgi:hypothetical protein
MRHIDYDKNWGSHLPLLIKIITQTKGDVLEMGMGLYSTPFLHWACFPNRKIISYENDLKCWEMNKQYNDGLHSASYIEDWDKADIEKPWDVVFVDHAPSSRRITDIKRLANYANYIIIHDTQRNYKFCNYKKIWPLFKYRYDYTKAIPWTSVVSNFVDLSKL